MLYKLWTGLDQIPVDIEIYEDKLGQSGDRILSSHITTLRSAQLFVNIVSTCIIKGLKGARQAVHGSRERDRGFGPPPGKSQIVICFLRNTGTDLP